MKRQQTGDTVESVTTGEKVKAFVPRALPSSPPLDLTGPVRDALDQAHMELGRLDGITSILPGRSGTACSATTAI